MSLNFNDFGKVSKEEILKNNLEYMENKNGLVTYTELKKEIKKEYGININWSVEEREKYCHVWLCSKNNRGCSPLYLTDEVYLELRSD